MAQASVLVVEDEPEMTKLLSFALMSSGFSVTPANSESDARDALRASRPDVIVLDLGLPDGDGLDLLESIRASGDEVPIIILTARDSVSNRVVGLEAGANDYMGKPFDMPELIARVRALLRRSGALQGKMLDVGNILVDSRRHEVRIDGKVISLTGRERQLLEELMRSVGQVVPKADLQLSLFGSEDKSAASRLDVITHRLRKKLASYGASATVHTFRGVGYMISDGD